MYCTRVNALKSIHWVHGHPARESEPLRTVVLYADRASACQVLAVREHILEHIAPDCQVVGTGWALGSLADPDHHERSRHEATEADVVLLAMPGADELPAPLEDWLEFVLSRKTGRPHALIVLLGTSDELPSWSALDDRLHELAERSGVDYFREWYRTPSAFTPCTLENVQQRAESMTSILSVILEQGRQIHEREDFD